MAYLLYILIINIFHKLLIKPEDNLNCNDKYTDCFNCSSCGDETSNICTCNWDKNTKICKIGSTFPQSENIGEYFASCTDDNSLAITKKYCGKKELELDANNEIKINIPKNDGFYGTNNLYCEYIFTALDKKDIFYSIKYDFLSMEINYVFLYLIITFNDKESISGYLSSTQIKKEFEDLKEIKLQIYFNKGLTSLPFSFKIKREGNKTKAILYITIGLIITSCLLCALIIYCLSKKISENARLRQRTLLELAMARQRGNYNVDEQASSGASEADIEEENKKKIEILLKTILAPKRFNKNDGIKDGNTCTICIEEFKEKKSKVSITPCQHVFHYKCLSNWLIQNVINPKCPNCNHNFLLDVDNKKIENVQTIEVVKRNNDIPNIETQDNYITHNNLDTNENRLITRNNVRSRSRASNSRQNNNHNIIVNGGNNNEIQEIVIENI